MANTSGGAFRPNLLLPLLIVAGLTLRMFVAWLPMEVLLGYVGDDFFYYLALARSIAVGHGPTADGYILTNGFHPIYALLLVPFFWLAVDQVTLVHLALSMIAVFGAVTAWLIYLITKQLADRWSAICAVIMWLFNPYVVAIAFVGVEVAVSTCLVALAILLYLRLIVLRDTQASRPALLIVGAAIGFACLGRTDNVFLALAVLIDQLQRHRPSSFLLNRFLWLWPPVVVVLLPWLVWNVYTFGSPMQVSGTALMHLVGVLSGVHGSSGFLSSTVGACLFLLRRFVVFVSGAPLVPSLILGILVGVAATVLAKDAQSADRAVSAIRKVLLPFVYVLGLLAFYGLVFRHYQNWYLYQPLMIGTILLAIIWRRVWISVLKDRANVATLSTLIVLTVSYSSSYTVLSRSPMYPWQGEMSRAAQWISANVATDEIVGAFNSGLYSFTSGRRVINLDGVVNNEAYGAITRGELGEYIQTSGIRWIVDYQGMIDAFRRDGNFKAPCEPVARIEGTFMDSDIVAYRCD